MSTDIKSLTKSHREFCSTAHQRNVFDTYLKEGSSIKVEKVLGVPANSVRATLKKVLQRAQKDPSYVFSVGGKEVVASPGFKFGKITVARRPEHECKNCGVITEEVIDRIWDRQTLEPADYVASVIENFEYKPLPVIKPPKAKAKSNLLNLYTITDFHLGMYACEAESGDSWDMEIAVQTFLKSFSKMIEVSPTTEEAIINIQGDFMHWDGLDPVTPTSGHVVDADVRFSRMIEMAMDLCLWSCELALQHHKKVTVIVAEGNHDISASAWLRKHLAKMLVNNTRVNVLDVDFPYYAYLFGETMIGVHHGHKKKNASLPALFSEEPRYRPMWGQAKYCFIHTGHLHHESMQISENGGALVIRHPTLASRDAHAVRGGYNSQRGAYVFTYNDKGYEVCRHRITPESL
jgi:hypothetical protein